MTASSADANAHQPEQPHRHGPLQPDPARESQRRWLLELTQIPTASGREHRVVAWIQAWCASRPDLALKADGAGNLVIEPRKAWGTAAKGATAQSAGKANASKRKGAGAGGPIFITAHLDHPAFVVERIVGPGTVELSFRGGVMDVYFEGARVVICCEGGAGGAAPASHRLGATITGESTGASSPFGKLYLAELDEAAPRATAGAEAAGGMGGGDLSSAVSVGDVGVWALPPSEVDEEGIVHAPACDDLAAAAAALGAYDVLREAAARGEAVEDVRLLFTRAEEIGFVGAIAACKLGTIPRGARVLALENSRSFADSPIGGGPIVRVGDRMSIFTPQLTAACAKRAEESTGNAAAPTASQKSGDLKGVSRWQRKLMAGGACEATVFCVYGYAATCLCLPLGNYHNMTSLQAVQEGTYDQARLGPPRLGREFISLADYYGLIDLLVAIGRSLPSVDPVLPRIEQIFTGKHGVLDEAPIEGVAALKGGGGQGKGKKRPKSKSRAGTTARQKRAPKRTSTEPKRSPGKPRKRR